MSDEVKQYEISGVTLAGRNNYTIPVGNFFFDSAIESELFLDKGSGFVPQVFGSDYTNFRRTQVPATVADAAIGFSIIGAVSAGWSYIFRWFERRIVVPPIAIAKVLVPASYTVTWWANDPTNFPNGIRVPAMDGMQIEFWRQTFRNGGVRGTFNVLKREGRRYLPYFRGAIDQFTFSKTEFCAVQNKRRNHYRVCYYDPLSGARSDLSADQVVVCSNAQDDRVNGRTQRTRGSVWIE